jgi:hypothetical protein
VEVAQFDATTDTVIPAHGPTLSGIANQMQDNSTVLLMQKRATSHARADNVQIGHEHCAR